MIMKRLTLLLLVTVYCSALTKAQDSLTFAIEAGVTSPRDPTATFGLIVGGGATRSYSRFAFDADGKARQVETGVERVVLHSKHLDLISRAVAGIVQDENNVSGTVAGSFGFQVPLRWGLSITALGEGANAPVRDGEWRGGASLTVRWVAR